MAYQYPSMVAFNPGTNAVVRNTVFQVYAPGDTSFTTPLAITDTMGNTLANLNSGALGVFPSFAQAQYQTVVVSDTPNHTYAWTVPCSQANPVVPWAASTYYTAGQAVVNPSGDVVTAAFAHTSGTSYNSANWNTSSTYALATVNGNGVVRKGDLVINVRDYGAKGDGATDDTAAFTAAVNHANSLNPTGTGASGVVGITVYVPDGRYVLNGAVTPILRSGVNITGSSENGAVLLLGYNGDTFTWGGPSDIPIGGGLSNVKLEYPAAPGASARVINIYQGSRLRFENLLLVNVGMLCGLGTSASLAASAVDFIGVRGYVYNGGNPTFNCMFGAALYLTNCRLFVGGVTTPAANRTSTMTTVSGTNVVNLGGGGSWDTLHITGCFFERFYRGVQAIAPVSVVLNDFFISNTYFDYIRQDVIWLLAQSASSGGIFSVFIDNCWTAAWEGTGVTMTGPGPVRGVSINNHYVPSAGTHGINIGAGASEITINAAKVDGANRTNVNAQGILVGGGSHIKVTNCTAGYDSTWAGFPWQAYNGLYLVANLDYYVIQGNDMSGTAGGYTFEANTAGSANRTARGNLGANYAGASALTVPASGTALTNTTPFVWEVGIYGGTVTTIVKDATTITGMTQGTIRVAPGETFTLTYSATPTLTRFILE